MPALERVQETELSSRIRLVNGVMPFTDAVTIVILCRAGSRNEDDSVAGISHLFEHMLFKGTDKYPTPQSVAERVEGVGGIFNAFTGYEMTGYWCKLPKAHYQRGLDVLADMVKKPTLDSDALEREKMVVYEEIRMYQDNPSSQASLLLSSLLWQGHPLGRDIAGSVDSVKAIGRAEMVSYFDSQYVADNMLISVSGNLEQAELTEQLEPLFENFRNQRLIKPSPYESEPHAPRIALEKREIEQTCIAMGFVGPDYTDGERYPFQLLSVILGGAMSSRLFLEVREKRGLAYDIGSSSDSLSDTGLLSVSCGVPPAKVTEAVKVILSELRKFCTEPVTPDELTNAKELIKGRTALRMEDSRAVAMFIGDQKLIRGEILSEAQIMESINAVTAEDISRVAQRYLVKDGLSLSLVGNFGDKEQIEQILSEW